MTTKCGRQSKLATRLMTASSFMLCRQQEFSAGLLVSQNVPEETMLSISKAVRKQKQLATVPASAVGLTCPSMTRTEASKVVFDNYFSDRQELN